MKKLLCLFLILGLAGCSNSTSNESNEDEDTKNVAYYQNLIKEGNLVYNSNEMIYDMNDENDYDTLIGFIQDDPNSYMMKRWYDNGVEDTFYYMNDYMYLCINTDGNFEWYYTDVNEAYAMDTSLFIDDFTSKVENVTEDEIDHVDQNEQVNVVQFIVDEDTLVGVSFDAYLDTILNYSYQTNNSVVVIEYESWSDDIPTDLTTITKLDLTTFASKMAEIFQ